MLDDYACILYLSRTFQEKYPFLKFPQDIKQMIYHLITSIQVIERIQEYDQRMEDSNCKLKINDYWVSDFYRFE